MSNHINDFQKHLQIFADSAYYRVLESIVVSIPACHAGDRGSIPRRGVFYSHTSYLNIFDEHTLLQKHANTKEYFDFPIE